MRGSTTSARSPAVRSRRCSTTRSICVRPHPSFRSARPRAGSKSPVRVPAPRSATPNEHGSLWASNPGSAVAGYKRNMSDPGPAPAMREERKAVTALDADVAGSTALGERLDAEEVRLVVGEAVARMVAAVEALGGTVKDLAGDGILALFGAPVAHEDDAERAVRAGLRIAEEMAAYGSEVAAGWGVDGFAVRIGVNTGSVVLGPVGGGSRVEYGATGDTINTAARLQSAAVPGTVLVGEPTYHLVEPLFDWGEPQDLELKGKENAVVAYRATGVRAVPGRARGVLGVETPFVGRDEQLTVALQT